MNSRGLRRTILGSGMAVGALTWWALRPTATEPTRVEPSTIEHASNLAAPASLDIGADPLALSRAPAEQVAQVVPDASVDAPTQVSRDQISILVIDHATRAPLAGMGVQMQRGPQEMSAFSNLRHWAGPIEHTDARGRAKLNGDPWSDRALVAAWDPAGHLGSASVEINPGYTADHNLVLELSPDKDFVLWMRIVDEETGDPIAGVNDSVAIDMSLPTPGGIPSYMRFLYDGTKQVGSNADGLLLSSGPEWTTHAPKLRVPEHATVWVTPEKGHETADKALRISTPRSASLRIHVVDTAGLPVRDCRVTLHSGSNQMIRPLPTQESDDGWGPRSEGMTDASGFALVEGLPPHVELRGETSGVFNYRIPAKVKLQPGEVRDVEWVVAGGVTLRGTLSDQTGAPIADCEIWLMRTSHERPAYFDGVSEQPGRRARTDASGRFVFASAEIGRFWVGPGLLTYNPESLRADVAPVAIMVDLVPRAEMNVELRSARGLYVRGHVIPPADEALLDGVVVVEDRARGVSMRAPWKADGSFSVGPLTSGPQTVVAQSTSGHAPSEPIVLNAGADDLKLQLGAGATISGRVLDVNGEGVQASILLTVHASSPAVAGTWATSANGDFSFTGLEPGMYDLAASKASGMNLAVLGNVEVASGASVKDLVLRLEPAGIVRVHDEQPHWSCEVQVEQNGLRVSARQFEQYELDCYLVAPAGSVLVRQRNTDTNEQRQITVEVEAGKVNRFAFGEQGH